MSMKKAGDKTAIFETMGVPKALAIMSLPAVAAQLVATTYGIADAWFIGCADNPYMIATSSLVQTFYLVLMALANLFGSGGGNLLARQLGKGDSEGAYNFARGDLRRMDGFFSATRSVLLALGLLSMGTCIVFARPIVSAFLDDPEVVRVGTALIRVRAISFPLMLLGLQTIYFAQAVDRGKLAFVLSVTRYVILCIPAMVILNALFGIDGLIWSQTVSDTAFLVVAILTYLRVRKEIGNA